MNQTQSILRSVNKENPRIFTLYTTMAHLRMLDDYQVYCLVNPYVGEPRTFGKENLPNVVFVNTHQALEFDLCVSFSGGLYGKILKDIAKEKNVDYLIYEMNYPNDIGTQVKYTASDKDSYFPSLLFSEVVKGNLNLIPPYVSKEFVCSSNILNRQISISTNCDFLVEKHTETNYDDLHYLFNTIPSQMFGFNPRLNTFCPSLPEFAGILNNTKIYLNTRNFGFYPMELLQAMCCGCAVLSYNYPGIEDFLGKEFVVNDKEECRDKISKLLGNKQLLSFASSENVSKSKLFRNGNILKIAIEKAWREINESGYKQYRV